MSGRNKVSGAEVAVRVGRRVVRIEVPEAVVVVAVIVAADIQRIGARVRVHKPQARLARAGNPGEIIAPTGEVASIL